MTETCDVGDTKRIKVEFRNLAGALADPTTVTFVAREPDDAETSKTWAAAEVQRESLGIFYFDWPFTKGGRHIFRWVGTGAIAEAASVEFWARRKQTVA